MDLEDLLSISTRPHFGHAYDVEDLPEVNELLLTDGVIELISTLTRNS